MHFYFCQASTKQIQVIVTTETLLDEHEAKNHRWTHTHTQYNKGPWDNKSHGNSSWILITEIAGTMIEFSG